jgi:hypothetical protein
VDSAKDPYGTMRKAGDIVPLKNGKKVRIKQIYSNGHFDYDEHEPAQATSAK